MPETASSNRRVTYFELEKEMLSALVQLDLVHGKRRSRPEQYLVYRREFPLGDCIPDLVFVSFLQEPEFRIRRLKFRYAHIISALRRHGSLDKGQLVQTTFLSLDQLSELMDELVERAVVNAKSNGKFDLANRAFWKETEVIAVEAKLSRWREALTQARTYTRFADKSLVVLDAGANISLPRDKDAFRSEGIGLYLAQPGETRLIVNPLKRTQPFTFEREYIILSASISSQSLWVRR